MKRFVFAVLLYTYVPQCHVVEWNIGQHTKEYKCSNYQYEYIEVGPTLYSTYTIGSPEVTSNVGTIRTMDEELLHTTALVEFLNEY